MQILYPLSVSLASAGFFFLLYYRFLRPRLLKQISEAQIAGVSTTPHRNKNKAFLHEHHRAIFFGVGVSLFILVVGVLLTALMENPLAFYAFTAPCTLLFLAVLLRMNFKSKVENTVFASNLALTALTWTLGFIDWII